MQTILSEFTNRITIVAKMKLNVFKVIVGDAICDEGALEWQYKKLSDTVSEKDLERMSLDQIQHQELKMIKQNASEVCDEVSSRIDRAPGHGGVLKAYTSDPLQKLSSYDRYN